MAKSHSLQCIFTAYIYYFCTAIRYGAAFPKIPNFNLVKKLADWTISAVPSMSKLTECLHSSSGLLGTHGSVRHPIVWQASVQAPTRSRTDTHTHTSALSSERQGANYGVLWQGTAVRKSLSPQADHSAPDILPACPLTVIGTLWYRSMKKQRHNGNLKAVVEDMLAVFSQQTL